MYLKSLELQGFKSFPDKIRLTFDEGLTAVVGPNGSGKSNIGDAVRWVLGEQSTKELRGKSMEDVIFSGTATRKPVGFAAVTLTIDNTDHALPESEPEVAVTRRLYRSGDSEYLINGRSVRLRDVNELFMDTGLGRDGYAIIGQGRIAEIVGAKSNERRDIFEEAAGVSKFRYKKQEAERKLAAAQENLLRLSDIVTELETRIGPLKIQSEKAERFLVLAEERKQLEVSVWVHRISGFSQQLQTLGDLHLQLTAEYENLQNDIAREEEKLQDAFREMQQATVAIEELQNKIVAAEQETAGIASQIAVCENEIHHSEDAILSLQAQQKELQQSGVDWTEKLAEQDAYLETLANEQTTLVAELADTQAQLAKISQQVQTQDTAYAEADEKLRQADLARHAEQARLQASEGERAETQASLLRGTQEASTVAERLRSYEKQQQALERKVAQLEEKRAEQCNRAEGFQRLVERKRQKYEETVSALTAVTQESQQVQQKQRILRDLEQSMEGYAGSVRQVLKVAGSGRLGGVYGTVAQLITVQPAYGTAIETALGGALQNLVVENEDAAKRCIRYLKEMRGGRATFLPLTTIRGGQLRESLSELDGFVALACDLVKFDERYRNVMENLLGRIAVAEDIDAATRIAKAFQYRFRIVTLDGQVIHAGGSFTGGSAARSAGVITRTHELEEAASRLQALVEEQRTLRTVAEQAKAEWDKLRMDAEGAQERIGQLQEQMQALEKERATLDAMAKADAAWQENDAAQQERLQKRLAQLDAAAAAATEQIARLTAQIAEAEQTRTAHQAENDALRAAQATCTETLSAQRMRQVALAKDLENERSHRIAMAQTMDASEQRLAELRTKLQQEKNTITQKQREIVALTEKRQSQRTAVEGAQTDIAKMRRLHEEKEQYTRVLREGTDALRDAREKQSGERSRVEERHANVQKEMDDLVFRMQEVYELTRSEAEAVAKPIENLRESETTLAAVKGKIRALGSVNVAAIDEYREVSERATFLQAQLTDIHQAKQELEALIETLTQDMCRIFSESFQKINQYFSEIFTELFGGGTASLTLTDPEHVLESGIEICVAPPGKVIRNLIALSGGEQSFVAICIYFAILKLRPAPFCILDEIDAALDEVNVRKYAQYIKRFVGRSQFVVITHRRSAMEEANVLYGVTMQEDGVSRLLRLDQSGMALAVQ